MRDNPTVTVLVMDEAGSKYETKDISGLSHFLEHMCFKGTVKRPKAIDIARELDSIGAQYNAFTSQEWTGYYAKSDSRHLDKIIDVVSDMYLNPVFNDVEIEKEKGVICEEINMYEDQPMRHIYDLWMRLLYGDQPAGWNVAGTKRIVKKLTRDDFINYRRKHYVAAATAVIVAGQVDETQVTKKIEESFKNISAENKFAKTAVRDKQAKPSVLLKYKKTDQTHLMIGTRSFDAYHDNNKIVRLILAILSGGMSSRLFQKLRDEMGVCYYVNADNDAFTDHGTFYVSAGVDSGRVKEVITSILGELNKLSEVSIESAELRKVKDYLIGNLFLSLESSDAQANFYGSQEILKKPIKTPEELVREIEKVDAESIRNVANQIFNTKNLNLAIIGKFKDRAEFLPILKF